MTIVLGANGAGKSTWVRSHRKDLPQPFYDADALAQELGDYNDPTCQITARAMVDAGVAHNIQRGVSFGIETTFAGIAAPTWCGQHARRVCLHCRVHRDRGSVHEPGSRRRSRHC